MKDTIHLGVIGAGNIAARHLANLGFIGGCRVVGIADPCVELAQQRAAACQARAYAGWEEMVEKERDLDALVLCAPPLLRQPVFVVAAARKLAVFCEKPPASTLAEARAIEGLIRESGMVCSVGFNCRYAPSADYCRSLIGTRTVNVVRAAFMSDGYLPGPGQLGGWFMLKEKGGGVFDSMIHTLDLIRYVAGPVVAAHAFGTNAMVPQNATFTVEDTLTISLRLAGGGTVSLVGTWACRQGMQDLTLFGADFQLSLSAIPPRVTGRIGGGSVKTEAVDKTFPQGPGMGRSGQVHPSRKPEDPPDPPHHDEMKVFLDAVRTGATAQIRSPFADAAQTVAVVDAVMRSVQTGQVVKVESVA